MERARSFFEQRLSLEKVYDLHWAVVYQVAGGAFLGAIDKGEEKDERTHVLISLTVEDAALWFKRLAQESDLLLTPLTEKKEVGLRSFFFDGPENYRFEIQEFLTDDLKEIFHR